MGRMANGLGGRVTSFVLSGTSRRDRARVGRSGSQSPVGVCCSCVCFCEEGCLQGSGLLWDEALQSSSIGMAIAFRCWLCLVSLLFLRLTLGLSGVQVGGVLLSWRLYLGVCQFDSSFRLRVSVDVMDCGSLSMCFYWSRFAGTWCESLTLVLAWAANLTSMVFWGGGSRCVCLASEDAGARGVSNSREMA